MTASRRRVGIAFLLVTAAVALPSLLWLAGGSRAAMREAFRLEEAVRQDASRRAEGLAAGVASRLEALRVSEGTRPFYHYQNLYHDPRGAAEGTAVVPSPLAQGPRDPWVWAYFQVDPDGRVSLPSLNEAIPELSSGDVGAQRAILKKLAGCSSACTRGLRTAGDRAAGFASPADRVRTERLDAASWLQNLRAPQLYADLKGIAGVPRCPLAERARMLSTTGEVEVEIGPFLWRTVPLEGDHALVALREVRTPVGPFVQGFALCGDEIATWLRRAGSSARLVRDPPPAAEGVVRAALPIDVDGGRFAIELDVGSELADARAAGATIERRFLRRFGTGVAAAWIVGLGVVGLVWQAERLASRRSRFAAAAAHELRTPLAGMRLYGEMLAEGIGDPERSRDYARRLALEADRLGRVVANVLGFARLERSAVEARPRLDDLAATVRECLERQRPALESTGATVTLEVDEPLPAVRHDREALAHALSNLLDNAAKYARDAEDRSIRVRLERVGDGAAVVVEDRGPGVPKGLRRRMFRPFERGALPDGPAGLGLGLALARSLVEAHGGTLRYDDAPGGGARFSIRLPG